MKRYILSTIAGGALMLGTAYAQNGTGTTPPQPAPGSTQAEAQHHETRDDIQQHRIQQGVKSGQLTPQQGRRLERQDARINREARGMAERNGGNLSQRQEARIHRQMNRQSRRIYRAKH